MTPSMRLPILPLLAGATLLAAGERAAASAQNDKLSEIPRSAAGSLGAAFVLAGERAVYTAGPTPIHVFEDLWSVPVDRSTPPVQLHDGSTQGSLQGFRVTEDGAWTLSLVSTNKTRLRAIRTDGSAPGHHVNEELVSGGNVLDFVLVPGSTRVVFRADMDVDGVLELHVRSIDASAPALRVSGPMVAGGSVTADYRVSPDGAWVVYRADQDANEVLDLYAAPLDGSGPARRLNASRPLADVEGDFAISFDSFGVVYRADQDTDGVIELYGVRIDGAFGSFKRSGPMVAGGDVLGLELSPLDEWLVYRADQTADEQVELHAVRAIAGGAPVRLNAPLPASGDVTDHRISPDAERVLFRATADFDEDGELWSAPLDGSAPAVRLHPALAVERGVTLYVPSPDGADVLFAADLETLEARELYRVPCDGSAPPARLTSAFDPGCAVRSVDFASGGSVVVYRANERAASSFYTTSDGLPELYAVRRDGSQPPVHLNRDVVTLGEVKEARVTADGAAVVYTADQRTRSATELFRVPLTGATAPLVLSEPLLAGDPAGDVVDFEIGRDGRDVFYTTSLDAWRVPLEGAGGAERITGPGGDETLRGLSPDGEHAVLTRYNAWLDDLLVIGKRLDGSVPPARIGRITGLLGAAHVQVTPDSTRVLFTDRSDAVEPVTSLRGAPLDGSAPAVLLDTSVADAAHLQVRPDGATVVYLRAAPGSTGAELHAAACDGSRPPVRLSAPLPAGGGLTVTGVWPTFVLTPDGSRVLYVGEQDADDVVELYGVPVDGSAPPVKLSGTLVAGGDVRTAPFFGAPVQPSPDGAWVLFVADRDTDEVFELYRAPVLGGAAPVKLSGALVAGGDVGGAFEGVDYRHSSVLVSADGQWVVYMADASVDELTELHAVRSDGSVPPVKLNGTLLATQDVRDFRIDPTSRRVVFHVSNGVLHSAPLDGSAPAVRLASRVVQEELAGGYHVTPDGLRVVYAARQELDVVEVFRVPIVGGAAAVRLSGPMIAGGNVQTVDGRAKLTVVPNGGRVLYLADQDRDAVVELYSTLLRHPPRVGAGAPGRTVVR